MLCYRLTLEPFAIQATVRTLFWPGQRNIYLDGLIVADENEVIPSFDLALAKSFPS